MFVTHWSVHKASKKIPLDDQSENAKRNPLDNESDNGKRNPLDEEGDNENNITSNNDYTPSSPSADSNDSDNDEPSDKNETTQGKSGGTDGVRARGCGHGGRGHGRGSMELGRGGRRGNAQQAQPASNVYTRIRNCENYECPNKYVHFSEYQGPNRVAVEPNTILEHFLLLFPMSVIEEIANETMIYYQQKSVCKNVAANFKVTKETMMAFFRINIDIGLAKLPSVHDYWAGGIMAMPWF